MKLSLLWIVLMPLVGQMTHERILHAEKEPGNWLTYSGNFAGHRFSPLKQINEQNVAKLQPAWVYQSNSLQKDRQSLRRCNNQAAGWFHPHRLMSPHLMGSH